MTLDLLLTTLIGIVVVGFALHTAYLHACSWRKWKKFVFLFFAIGMLVVASAIMFALVIEWQRAFE